MNSLPFLSKEKSILIYLRLLKAQIQAYMMSLYKALLVNRKNGGKIPALVKGTLVKIKFLFYKNISK